MSKICELCKTDNDDENLFCEKCGNPLTPPENDISEEDKVKVEKIAKGAKVAIPATILLLLIVAGFYGFSKYQTHQKQESAAAVVTAYLNDIKNDDYISALKNGTGFELTQEWNDAFKNFQLQLIPRMPESVHVLKAKENLALINERIERFIFINRKFPASLSALTPVIMNSIPEVPGGGEFGYEFDQDAENYTVFVKGKVFEKNGLPENFPAFSRKDRLQSPGEKKVFGEWKLKDFIITNADVYGDTVRLTVKETSQFGPTLQVVEDVYVVKKHGDKWLIDSKDSPSKINPINYDFAFSQMEDIAGPKVKPKTESTDDKAKPSPKSEGATDKDEAKESGEGSEGEKTAADSKSQFKFSLGMLLLKFTRVTEEPQNLKLRRDYQLRKAKEALERIGQAQEKYYRDNGGKYPSSLLWLIPDYLQAIPENPATLTPEFVDFYEVSENREVYTVYCGGKTFNTSGLEDDYPQYTSRYRLISSTEELKSKEARLPKPDEDETPDSDDSPDKSNTPSPDATSKPKDSDASPKPKDSDATSPDVKTISGETEEKSDSKGTSKDAGEKSVSEKSDKTEKKSEDSKKSEEKALSSPKASDGVSDKKSEVKENKLKSASPEEQKKAESTKTESPTR